TVEVTDTSLAPATSTYIWDFGDGGTANGPTATHTFSGTGTYTVSLVVSACGRMDTVMQEVAITTLGLAEREGLSEMLPAVVFTDVLPVEAQEAVRAELLTVEGRVVASTRLRPGLNTWSPGSDLPAALYTMRTLTATGAVERWQRVVKER
ncbi:MAG: PKD domain-containing protein, partial [Flavobacteriales bacterium]|nr:PKD domain-containing protein [Flavobacteriales bacterium]